MPKIKTDFVISGEKQYKQAISEINSGLGVLDSEMKKVSAQYRDNGNSVEALTAKNDVLERKLLTQKEKVEQLRQALANSAEQYGEADKRTMKWQKSLNEAEAALADTEHEIRENNKAMTETSETTEELSINVKDLASQFGVHLPGGLDKALSSMKGFSTGSIAAVSAVTIAITALVNAEKQLVNLTKETAAKADDLLTLSKVTGLDTQTIQQMQYASELIDVSFETIKGSMTKLKRSQDSARDGNKELLETFALLGVQIQNTDGTLRNTEDVFYDVIDALGKIDSAADRDVMAMQIFGKSAEELNPLILAGSGALKEYAAEAENVNYILSEESLEALAAVDDAYQRMQKTQESIKQQMAVEMAPAVEDLYTAWTDFMLKAGEALIDSGIIDGLAEILKAVAGLLDPISEINNVLIPGTDKSLNTLRPTLSMIGGLLASIADAIDVIKSLNLSGIISGDLFNALGFGYGSGNANHYQTWRMQQEGTYDQYTNYYTDKASRQGTTFSQFNRTPENAFYSNGKWYDRDTGWEIPGYATGTYNFAGGRALVGENGPELVDLPGGSRIWNAQDTRGAGGVVINGNIILDAGSVEDLVDAARFLEDLRVVRRMG